MRTSYRCHSTLHSVKKALTINYCLATVMADCTTCVSSHTSILSKLCVPFLICRFQLDIEVYSI